MRSLERVNIRTNERTYVRTYSHTYVRDRPYIPSTTLLCEGIIIRVKLLRVIYIIHRYRKYHRASFNIKFIRQDQKQRRNGEAFLFITRHQKILRQKERQRSEM